MPTLLVIDDDRAVLRLVEHAFLAPDLKVLATNNVQTGFDLISEQPDVVLLDIVMPEMSGLDAAKRIRSIDPKLPVVFITSCGDSETAIEAMKLGAYDLVLKPLDLPKLREIVERALEIRRLMHVPVQMVTASDGEREVKGDQIVGRSPAMQEVFKAIGRVAPQRRYGTDSGRKRHRQGVGRPGALSPQPAGGQAVPGRQLRRHSGNAFGK